VARLDTLGQIKDEVIPVIDRAARLARLDALAQIKDDLMPVTDSGRASGTPG
jgi:hypothetical protein